MFLHRRLAIRLLLSGVNAQEGVSAALLWLGAPISEASGGLCQVGAQYIFKEEKLVLLLFGERLKDQNYESTSQHRLLTLCLYAVT